MENKAISSDLIRGHIDTIILYSLTDSDKHAQQISDYVAEKSNDEYQINQATLYSSLKRLESLKYVAPYWHSAETGRRRYFKITDLGREIIKENTESWSYSRNIIDKLINCEPIVKQPEPEIITKFIEKPVVIYKNVNENLTSSNELQPQNNENLVLNSTNVDTKNDQIIEEKPQNDQKTPILQPETNFRLVLSDLIKSTEKQKIVEEQKILKVENQEIEQESIQNDVNVAKFNDTIREDFDFAKTASNNIDFSDIIEKGQKEGYKVNVSSTDKPVKLGSVFINKVRFFASSALFLLMLIEILLLITLSKPILTFNVTSILLPIISVSIFPVVCAFVYFKDPAKTSTKIKKDSILTYGIIIFNLILFTFVLNLLFETDFYQTSNLLLYLFVPFAIFIDVFLYSVIKYYVSNKKPFINHK
jgi:PadR family transcriptional regulator PadR